MCGFFCCEAHHVRHPTYVNHDIASPAARTGGTRGACPHPENVHDERIRTVGDPPCSTCAVCVAIHTGRDDDDMDDEPYDEPDDHSSRKEDLRNGVDDYDHSRAKEDARNARYR